MEVEFEWRPLRKRAPRDLEVVRLKANEPECKQYFGMWDKTQHRWFIFDIYNGHWATMEQYLLGVSDKDTIRCPLDGWEYAYIPNDKTKFIPFYALAFSRKREVIEYRDY